MLNRFASKEAQPCCLAICIAAKRLGMKIGPRSHVGKEIRLTASLQSKFP